MKEQKDIWLAVIDLGSSGFRLQISSYKEGQLKEEYYQKQQVMLGIGLDNNRNLTPHSLQQAYACLEQFSDILKKYPVHAARVVATQTLREANNNIIFLKRAKAILNMPVDIISGEEEAELIYQGAAKDLPINTKNLIIDIGGRSTEIIIGENNKTQYLQSLEIGSITLAQKYFLGDKSMAEQFVHATQYFQSLLQPLLPTFQHPAWSMAYGTLGAIQEICALLKSKYSENINAISYNQLLSLQEDIIKFGKLKNIPSKGNNSDNKAIIYASIIILFSLFKTLQITQLYITQGTLRHGVLYELLKKYQ